MIKKIWGFILGFWNFCKRHFYWVSATAFSFLLYAGFVLFLSFSAWFLSFAWKALLPVLIIASALIIVSFSLVNVSYKTGKDAEKEYDKVKPWLFRIPGFVVGFSISFFEKVQEEFEDWDKKDWGLF